jgi:hypothetical protein
MLLAVVWGIDLVANMLYESGSCSPTELFQMHEQLWEILNPDTDRGRTWLESINEHINDCFEEDSCSGEWQDIEERQQRYDELTKNITTFLPCLKEMVGTPHSLKSTCRLVILRCLTVRRRRERAVQQLTLPVRSPTGELESERLLPDQQKNYLLFF